MDSIGTESWAGTGFELDLIQWESHGLLLMRELVTQLRVTFSAPETKNCVMAKALERGADRVTFYLEDTALIVAGGEGKSLVGKAIESSLGV
ncbi:MAG: hypothetical protein ACLP3K_06135 [Candidatus Acidiferrales bacterium]